jgi:hypothetical protein
MKRTIRAGGLWATCLLSTLLANVAQSQDAKPRYSELPADSVAMISVDVAAVKSQPELELIPWEIISTATKEQFGFDAVLIQSIDVTVGMPSPAGPEIGASIRTSQKVDIADFNLPDLGELQTSPKRADLRFRQMTNSPIRLTQTEPNRVFLGTDATLRRMLANKSTSSKSLEVLKDSQAPVRVVLAMAPLRDMALGFLEDFPGQLPPPVLKPLRTLLEKTKVIRVTSTVGMSSKLGLDLYAEEVGAVKELESAIAELRDFGVAMAEAQVKANLENDPNVSDAMKQSVDAYAKRLKKALSVAQWKVNGDRLSIEIDSNGTAAIGIATGLLLPAVQAARAAAQRMSGSNNQKQIMLALLNYESAYKAFPNRVWKKDGDTPLLSWRVAILPFIEEAQLYQEFHLDEPWDSPHNIKLLDRMPATLKNPRVPTQPGYTTYLWPCGEGTLGNEEGKIRFAQITDGTSNTISIVEVNGEHAVPWTCPDDIDVDEVDLLEAFLPDGSNVGMWDGSVHFLSRFIDAGILEAMLTHNGGEVVNFQP